MPDLKIEYVDENGTKQVKEFDTVMDFLDGPFLFDKDTKIVHWELFQNKFNSGTDTTFGWLYEHCEKIVK